MTAVATRPEAPTPPASQRRGRRGRTEWSAYLRFVPAMIPILAFSVYPLVQGILLGFTDSQSGLNAVTSFTGIDNYVRLLDYGLFWQSFGIGLIWAFSVTIIQFVASLSLALLLNANLWGQGIARTIALIPWAMPPVIIAIMWRFMLHPTYGAINGGLGALGLPDDTNWLAEAPRWGSAAAAPSIPRRSTASASPSRPRMPRSRGPAPRSRRSPRAASRRSQTARWSTRRWRDGPAPCSRARSAMAAQRTDSMRA